MSKQTSIKKIVQLTFVMKRRPHPDPRHLGSRLFLRAKIKLYTSDMLIIETRLFNKQQLIEEIIEYGADRGVKIELIDTKEA